MKSKLFLSLSLLTAVFSQASDVMSHPKLGGYVHTSTGTNDHSTRVWNSKVAAKLAQHATNVASAKLGGLALVGTAVTAGVYGYNHNESTTQAELAKQAELANRSYVQIAKDGIVSGYNTAKTKASELYTNATYENMKNGMVNGFSTAKTFAMENKALTAGAVAGTAAVVYGAYKLYNSDMFAKSKKQPTPVVKAPVAKQPVIKNRPFVYGV